MTSAPAIRQPDQFPDARGHICIRGPAGRLECAVDVPKAGAQLPAVAVLCHPHPLHGGTMHNKVVTIMERALRELGLYTIRFNYRGVGDSEGSYDDGYGESDDLMAVVDWVRRVCPDHDLWLGGFSFGAYITLRVAQNLAIKQLISIAPAVERYEFANVEHPQCPWLIIQGDEDELVSVDAVQEWVAQLDPQPELIVMPEADHLFHRRLMDLRGLIKNGVRQQLPVRETSN